MTPTMIAPTIDNTTPSTTFLSLSSLFSDGWLVGPAGIVFVVIVVVDVDFVVVDDVCFVVVVGFVVFVVVVVVGFVDVFVEVVVVGVGGKQNS